jgi:hypothetical protein
MRNAYNILVGKSEGKIPHGTPRHEREGNIKLNLKEVILVGLSQDRDL